MKKQYLAPEVTLVEYNTSDIITGSIATSSGDNTISAPTNWWD